MIRFDINNMLNTRNEFNNLFTVTHKSLVVDDIKYYELYTLNNFSTFDTNSCIKI